MAETPTATLRYAPADAEGAAALLDLIDELCSRVEHGRAMGLGDVAIANGIRAQMTDQMLDVALAGIPEPTPISDELLARLERTRRAVREEMRAPSLPPGGPQHG